MKPMYYLPFGSCDCDLCNLVRSRIRSIMSKEHSMTPFLKGKNVACFRDLVGSGDCNNVGPRIAGMSYE